MAQLVADRADKLPVIAGKVDGDRFSITLPDEGLFRLRLEAHGWLSEPVFVPDPKAVGELDLVMYPAAIPEPALAEELKAMGEQDLAMRKSVPAGQPDAAFLKRWEDGNKQREKRLGEIIDSKGWPTVSKVGHEAETGAWLIAQHGSPDFLKRCLALMFEAADRHEVPLAQLALSIDRVLANDHMKQFYGSQFVMTEEGKQAILPVEDPVHLDERRRKMGLEAIGGIGK
ncbi:MAG: DUF6624 domain-containing protein [Massilia sp.]